MPETARRRRPPRSCGLGGKGAETMRIDGQRLARRQARKVTQTLARFRLGSRLPAALSSSPTKALLVLTAPKRKHAPVGRAQPIGKTTEFPCALRTRIDATGVPARPDPRQQGSR